jgi:hypothetical protein
MYDDAPGCCASGRPWYNRKNAVAPVTRSGSFLCEMLIGRESTHEFHYQVDAKWRKGETFCAASSRLGCNPRLLVILVTARVAIVWLRISCGFKSRRHS